MRTEYESVFFYLSYSDLWLCRLIWIYTPEQRAAEKETLTHTNTHICSDNNNNGTVPLWLKACRNRYIEIQQQQQSKTTTKKKNEHSKIRQTIFECWMETNGLRVRCVNYDMSRKTHCRCHFQLFASIVVSKLSWNGVFLLVVVVDVCIFPLFAFFVVWFVFRRSSVCWCIFILFHKRTRAHTHVHIQFYFAYFKTLPTMSSVKSPMKYAHHYKCTARIKETVEQSKSEKITDIILIWTHDCFDYEDYDGTQSTSHMGEGAEREEPNKGKSIWVKRERKKALIKIKRAIWIRNSMMNLSLKLQIFWNFYLLGISVKSLLSSRNSMISGTKRDKLNENEQHIEIITTN